MKNLLYIGVLVLVSQTLIGQTQQINDIDYPPNETFGFSMNQQKNEVFFVWSHGGRDTLNIYHAVKKNGKWQKPKPAPFTGKAGAWKDIDPFITPDGQHVYFQSTRPIAPGKGNNLSLDHWIVSKNKKGWGKPRHLGGIVNSDSAEAFISVSENKTMYFGSARPGNYHGFSIFSSEYENEEWQVPKSLDMIISTQGRSSNPFIAYDESYLIFSRDEPANYGGSDLYISFNTEGGWTVPWNLGETVNTSLIEFCPFMLPKEDTLYFARLEIGATFRENLYKVHLPVQQLRQRIMAQAEIFEPNLISTDNTMNGTFSPDGKVFYFSRSNNDRSVVKLYQTQLLGDNSWSLPTIIPFSEDFTDARLPFVTTDGEKMIFTTTQQSPDLWMTNKEGEEWSLPYKLPEAINTEEHGEYFATQSNNGVLYFSSSRDEGKCDIYKTKMIDGVWQPATKVDGIVTDNFSESNPLIAPDESYMIFLSDRPDGFGAFDLYISYYQDGVWTTPQNLGPQINSEYNDFQPGLSPDGKYFYFTRMPWPAGAKQRQGPENIYRIDSKVLRLRD